MVKPPVYSPIIAHQGYFNVLKNLPRITAATGYSVAFAKRVKKFVACWAGLNARVVMRRGPDCHDR